MGLRLKGRAHCLSIIDFFLVQKKIVCFLIVLRAQKAVGAQILTGFEEFGPFEDLSWILKNLTWIFEIWSHFHIQK